MKQLNLIAIPNGAFTLDRVLQNILIQESIQKIQKLQATKTAKIKEFLTYYQIMDTLAQMQMQGLDISSVNEPALVESMKYTVEVCYDSIMKSFTNQERKQLHDLVEQPAQ